jgi:hypothetical protein
MEQLLLAVWQVIGPHKAVQNAEPWSPAVNSAGADGGEIV